MATIGYAQRSLAKAGFAVVPMGHGVTASRRGLVIDVGAHSDGTVAYVRVRSEADTDDDTTDYLAGSLVPSVAKAIRLADRLS